MSHFARSLVNSSHQNNGRDADFANGNKKSDNAPPSNLRTALALAGAGLPIFPARATLNTATGRWDKAPIVAGWQSKATTDQNQIESWWDQFPGAVPGIELGSIGLLVIDADRHGGPDGVAALHELMADHGEAASNPITISAGGGEHHYFRQPDGEAFGNRRGSLPPGIDVRGEGAWIVAPGSMRPDGATWAASEDRPTLINAFRRNAIPTLPACVADRLRRPLPKKSEPPVATETRPASTREEVYARTTLAGCAAELAQAAPGTRNSTLNAIAYRMGRIVARNWIGPVDVADAVWTACESNGLVGDDGPDAVQKTLASGLDAGRREPAEDLEDRPLVTFANDNAIGSIAPSIPVIWDGDTSFAIPTWLVKDLVPEACVGLFVGESGAAKSFTAVDLAVSVAIGSPFFNRPTKRGGTLYVAAEAGATIAERIEAARLGYVCPTLEQSNGDNVDPRRLPIALISGVPDLATDGGAERLMAVARHVAAQMPILHRVPLRLVVIDTLVAAFALQGWNDPADASKAMKVLSAINGATGATVLGVHHHGKDVSPPA